MPVFIEFLLVAIAIFLWESTLWLPLRCVALRKRWFSQKWRCLDPRAVFSTRELGVVPMMPLPPDAGLAPCQSPPLVAVGEDEWLLERGEGVHYFCKSLDWNDLKEESHHLRISGTKIRISSPRYIDALRRSKQRGLSVDEAVRRSWRRALSPVRAGLEWKRWKLTSGPLRWYGLVLTLGFFVGLPIAYVFLSNFSFLMLCLWLWCLMAGIAAHLWWLAKRVYPDAGAALKMDAVLALLVPFHAMRAHEIAAVHAMGTTHPAALLIWAKDFDNPWLTRFFRRVLYPSPNSIADARLSKTLRPWLECALSIHRKRLEDFDHEPDRSGDRGAQKYCPRCHGLFMEQVHSCPDCGGITLRSLDRSNSA